MRIVRLTVCTLAVLSLLPQATSAETFTVSPSGDVTGVTDWNNLMLAFDDASWPGEGNTVQMTAGDFYFHRPIMVTNFSGTLAGAGTGVTNLRTAPGVLFGVIDDPTLVPAAAFMSFHLDPVWPAGHRAGIEITDLSIMIEGPTRPYRLGRIWESFLNAVIVRGRTDGIMNFERSLVDVSMRHVEIAGYEDRDRFPVTGRSLYRAVNVLGEEHFTIDAEGYVDVTAFEPVSGMFEFRDMKLDSSVRGLALTAAVDSHGTFGGQPRDRILARNLGETAVVFWDVGNSDLEVSYLQTEGSPGIGVIRGFQAFFMGQPILPEPSRFVFTHNIIDAPFGTGWAGIDLWNIAGLLGPGTGELGDVLIAHNKIRSVDGYTPFEAISAWFVDDVIVTNNVITGSGTGAIWVAPIGEPCSGWMLKGNNVQGFEAEMAQIYLGDGTFDCTVVGGACRATVLDEGTNNTLVGVTPMQGNAPGQRIKEAMERKRELLEAFK